MTTEEKLVYGSILGLGALLFVVVIFMYFKRRFEIDAERLAYKELKWSEYAREKGLDKYFRDNKVIPYKEALKKNYVPNSIKEDKSGARLNSSTGSYDIIPAYLYVDVSSGGSCGDFGGGDGGGCGGGD